SSTCRSGAAILSVRGRKRVRPGYHRGEAAEQIPPLLGQLVHLSGEARDGARRGLHVHDAFARSLVDLRDGFLQGLLRAGFVLAGEGRADALDVRADGAGDGAIARRARDALTVALLG